jgi:hypothetical protein
VRRQKATRDVAGAGIAAKYSVAVAVTLVLALHWIGSPKPLLQPEVWFWIILVSTVELIPLPQWKGVQLSLSSPLLLAVLVLYQPFLAATIALIGAADRREFRREVPFSSALFNRGQIALSVLTGGFVFHSLASIHSKWYTVIPAVLVAKVADYLVNVTLVATILKLSSGRPFGEVLQRLRVGALPEFLLN